MTDHFIDKFKEASLNEIEGINIIDDDEKEKEGIRSSLSKINWDAFTGVYGDISKEEVDRWKRYIAAPDEEAKLVLFNDGVIYAKFFSKFLNCKGLDEIGVVLVYLDDLFAYAQNAKKGLPDIHTILGHFYALQKGKQDPHNQNPPFGALMSILNHIDDKPPIYLKLACRLLNTFILNYTGISKDNVENMFTWIDNQLPTEDEPKGIKEKPKRIYLVLLSLRPLLSVNDFRILFASDPKRLKKLEYLSDFKDRREEVFITVNKKKKGTDTPEVPQSSGPNFQLMYEALYCLWCLSFNTQVKEQIAEKESARTNTKETLFKHKENEKDKPYPLISNLCHIVKRCNKVKVLRITLAILRNLIGVGKCNELMICYNLPSSIALLKQKRWGDEEMEADIKDIEEALEKNVDDLTTWDRYKAEIMSGRITWSAPHKSPKFWQENFLKFEEGNFMVLNELKSILNTEGLEPEVYAIACWDVGEFVRVHPSGKRICQSLDLKTPIMKKLTTSTIESVGDKSEEYKKLEKEALSALQKLMITNWEYLQQ